MPLIGTLMTVEDSPEMLTERALVNGPGSVGPKETVTLSDLRGAREKLPAPAVTANGKVSEETLPTMETLLTFFNVIVLLC